MGTKAKKKLRKFQLDLSKKRINPNDPRLKAAPKEKVKKKTKKEVVREAPKVPSSMFFQYNTNLRPPYNILLDTNFINMSIQMKLDVFKASMECLVAKCNPCITDCVMGELEKMGTKYRLALRIAKDPRFTRLTCCHKGTYADDCICERVMQHRCYIVGTNDKDLKRRIRKIPGIPILSVARGKYKIERVPEDISSTPIRVK
uniref:PIN domain-containing protein n=1 Tax=Noctiluca scintillans TaxID=2966 RepID=A0A7S1AXJ3_NOCSC